MLVVNYPDHAPSFLSGLFLRSGVFKARVQGCHLHCGGVAAVSLVVKNVLVAKWFLNDKKQSFHVNFRRDLKCPVI